MRTWSKTKIVATMGPASSPPEVLMKMIEAGLDVCRINSSHGSYEAHQKVIDTIREINKKTKSHIAVLFGVYYDVKLAFQIILWVVTVTITIE